MAAEERPVLLVVPCFNEEKRLRIDDFKAAPPALRFLFVDDGSTDGTFARLQSSQDPRMQVLRLEKNGGKAEAIRQGMLYALKRPDQFTADWFGYWDADLSTPLSEIANFLRFNEIFYDEQPVIFGSRVFRYGGVIDRYLHRHILGRVFATVVRQAFGIGSYDSQCGAKLFKKSVIERCFAEPFVSRWIFDVEIILRLGKEGIVEYPLKRWRDVSGGTLNVPKTALTVVRDIFKMKRRYGVKK